MATFTRLRTDGLRSFDCTSYIQIIIKDSFSYYYHMKYLTLFQKVAASTAKGHSGSKIQQYLCSLDQSTTGTKFTVFTQQGQLLAQKIVDHKQYTPHQGWLEHDPVEIMNNVHKTIDQTLEKVQQID